MQDLDLEWGFDGGNNIAPSNYSSPASIYDSQPRTPTVTRHYDWTPQTPSTSRVVRRRSAPSFTDNWRERTPPQPVPGPAQMWYLKDDGQCPVLQCTIPEAELSLPDNINGHPIIVIKVEEGMVTFMMATSMNNTSLTEHCLRGNNHYATHCSEYLPIAFAPTPLGVPALNFADPENAALPKHTYVKVSETWLCRVEDLAPYNGAVPTFDCFSQQVISTHLDRLTLRTVSPGRVSPPPASAGGLTMPVTPRKVRVEGQGFTGSPIHLTPRKTTSTSVASGPARPGGVFSQPPNTPRRSRRNVVSVA